MPAKTILMQAAPVATQVEILMALLDRKGTLDPRDRAGVMVALGATLSPRDKVTQAPTDTQAPMDMEAHMEQDMLTLGPRDRATAALGTTLGPRDSRAPMASRAVPLRGKSTMPAAEPLMTGL